MTGKKVTYLIGFAICVINNFLSAINIIGLCSQYIFSLCLHLNISLACVYISILCMAIMYDILTTFTPFTFMHAWIMKWNCCLWTFTGHFTYDYEDELVYCYCGVKAPLVTSTSNENPKKTFFWCSNYKGLI